MIGLRAMNEKFCAADGPNRYRRIRMGRQEI
jgi:hypothetical protein